MGLRFQRRIKIAPGITLVASKRGVGLSGGVRGARVSVTPSGVHTHGGIPGTGLAYRSKLDKKGGKGSGRGARGEKASMEIGWSIDADGVVSLSAVDGVALSEQQAREAKKVLETPIREELELLCASNNATLDAVGKIHHQTPAPQASPVFTAKVFDTPAPKKPALPQGGVWEAIWPPAKRRLEVKRAAIKAEYAEVAEEWAKTRAAFMAAEAERERRETVDVWTSLEAMAVTLETHLAEILWPRETEVTFDLGDNSKTVAASVNLPSEDEMPYEEWRLHGSQLRLTRKTLTATRRREAYRNYVHGVAIRVLGEVFARLPTVQVALVNGVVTTDNSATGEPEEAALYSVIARRSEWSQIWFDRMAGTDPGETLGLFNLRRDLTKTGVFRTVQPFSVEELEDQAKSAR